VSAAGRGLHVDGQSVGDNRGRLFRGRHSLRGGRVRRIRKVQQHSGDNGQRPGALLRAHAWHAHVLRHDLRHGLQADDGDLRDDARGSWTLDVRLLRFPGHEDQPYRPDLQSRTQGVRKTPELYEPTLAAGYLLLSSAGTDSRRGHVGRDGPAAHDPRVSGPQVGRTALQEHERGDRALAHVQYGVGAALHHLRV